MAKSQNRAIFYCPLEAYKERYTMQLSAPEVGWLERNWRQAGITYVRVEGDRPHEPQNITTGVALDAIGRSKMCFAQVSKLLDMMPGMGEDDVIYFDDFWHPGIEAIAYAAHMMNRPLPKMYANLWAQSVDEFDFTYGMRDWMRYFEKGFGTLLSGIFVACPSLKDLVVHGGIAHHEKVHAVGHPFSSEEVKSRMPELPADREDKVVYCSRWDREKNPDFFLRVVDTVLAERPHTQFVVCSSHEKLRSNHSPLLGLLTKARKKHGDKLVLMEGLTKEEYYAELASAKVHINTADQDWISFVLLEASCAGAYPVYPYFRSFPEVFEYKPDFMYQRLHVPSAAAVVKGVLDATDLWTEEAIQSRAWVHERFDNSWERMATIMGVYQGDQSGPF